MQVKCATAYHPENSEERYAELLAALQEIGLIQPVVTLSRWSDGLHIYYPLPKPVKSFGLACAVKWTLFDAGISLADGQVETFPNCKSYGRNEFVNYKAHRLPLQPGWGSFLLDSLLLPYSIRNIYIQIFSSFFNKPKLAAFRRLLGTCTQGFRGKFSILDM